MTKPSRFLENGLAAACGLSLLVDSAESREKRITASGLIEPSVPTQSAASVSPRRIASTPSWIALAPEAQAVDSEIGEPLRAEFVGQMIGDRAEQETFVIAGKPVLARSRSL